LTVSEDPRLTRTVRELTAKTAETVGVAAGPASRLGAGVERVVMALAARPGVAHGLQQLDVRFEVGPDALRVEIECGATTAGWTLERWLAERGDLDELRALAPDVDVIVPGGRCVCHFTCAYAPHA
jgi:hypothetical protein